MDVLIGKNIYKYTQNERSKITYKGRFNCCFISSFQIQMKNIFNDFPSLDYLLENLYENQTNVFTHFAFDFPEKWFILKKLLISKDKKWKDLLNKIVIRMFISGKKTNESVLLTTFDLSKIDSIRDAIDCKITEDSFCIDIIQKNNHFEPIIIVNMTETKIDNLNQIGVDKSFFN